MIFEGYVDDIFKFLTTTPRTVLKHIENSLKDEIPQPLHTMLEKVTKEDAVKKHLDRKGMVTKIVPPTCSGEKSGERENNLFPLFNKKTSYVSDDEYQALANPRESTSRNNSSQRRKPMCKKCGKPMKGHKRGQCS